jgi:hypothetical protein
MNKTQFSACILCLGVLAALGGCGNGSNTLTMQPPDLASVLPGAAMYGDTIVVGGSGFSADPSANCIVISPDRFSDPVARRVIVPFGGSQTVLRGIVPDGSFSGSVRIERPDLLGGAPSLGLQSPAAASNALGFAARLVAGNVGKSFFSGSDYSFQINTGDASEDYLVVLFSSAVAPDRTWTYLYDITAQGMRSSAGGIPASSPIARGNDDSRQRSVSRLEGTESDMGSKRREFGKRIDEEIGNLLRKLGGAHGAPGRSEAFRPAISGPGAPAQTVQFQVLIDPDESILDPANYKTVEAHLMYSGDHTLLYVDVETPALFVTEAEAENLGFIFDASIHGTDRSCFGNESDINHDGKVAILMSPAVNEMTPPGMAGSQGFIAGYFLPNDLLPQYLDPRMTNGMEIFYTMIPDPTGQFGNVFPKDQTLPVIEGVLAHEFLHMILFNYRVLIYGLGYMGDYMEEIWLNEGLAHIAENLNGYESSNIARANRYLADPGNVTLIYGGDELDERGASFLFLRHLGDRFGSGIFKKLVQSRKTGVANVEAATGQYFRELFADWSAACYLSGRGITDDPRFNYSSIDLQADFRPIYTLSGNVSGTQIQGFVKAMAPEYILFTVPAAGSCNFTIGSDASGRMNAAVIRLR